MLSLTFSLQAQTNLDVEGQARITQMATQNDADSVVVWLPDGTLAIRPAGSLAEYQIISISNDTIYLSNGGFVKLPAGFDGQYNSLTGAPQNVSFFTNDAGYLTSEVDGSVSNELQTISRSGLTVSLTDGGSYQDSVNVYTAGAGIDITNNVISTIDGSSSPWYLGKDTLGGIVYYIYKGSDGQEHGLIVSKTETTAQWQSTSSTTNATRSWDGVYNTGLMTNSPAKNWIATNFTSEWYLPSIDELSLLWHNRFHVNKALFEGSLTLLDLMDTFWSSTEYGPNHVWCINNPGFANANGKANTYSVRSIRAF